MPLHQGASSTDPLVQHAADQMQALNLAVAEESGNQSDSFEVTEALKQQSRAAADLQLPPGWTKFTDDYGVSYYSNAPLGTIQYTHPSLNAPPFSPDLTDYVMGHPAPHASAWAWMLYLWLREVKATHSVVGTLCALRLCAPPRDQVFQRRIIFRMWFMTTSLLASTFFYAAFALRFSPNFNLLTDQELSLKQQVAACQTHTRCFLLTSAFYAIFVSVPFAIFRCERLRLVQPHFLLSTLRNHAQVPHFSRLQIVSRARAHACAWATACRTARGVRADRSGFVCTGHSRHNSAQRFIFHNASERRLGTGLVAVHVDRPVARLLQLDVS